MPILMPRITSTLALALSATLFSVAQPPADTRPPDTPAQSNLSENAPLNPKLPTIFLVGDSTCRNNADLGWGDHFAHYFDTTRVNIANRCMAGRSSRSYIAEGRWDNVLAEIKAGDFVLIQMGHNDGGSAPSPDFKGRGSWKGIGEETLDIPIATPYKTGPLVGKTTETVHTYGWYLRKYIADARSKGATPILLTVTIRNIWATGADGKQHIERDMGFRNFENQIGAAQNVPVIDMATVEADRLEATGPEKTALLFPIDHTHTSAAGAELNAQSIVIALEQAKSPLVGYLKQLVPQPVTVPSDVKYPGQ